MYRNTTLATQAQKLTLARWFTDDSRKVRVAHVRETSIELRESSPILRESFEVNVITLSQCPLLKHGWCSLLDQPCTA